MQRILVLFSLWLVLATGQDPGLVLRTFVGYNAMSASLPLSPELKAEVQMLGKTAMSAAAQGKTGEALKLLHKGTAVMNGLKWNPALSLAYSLQPSVDHALWEAGDTITVRMKPLYPPEADAPDALKATLSMRALPKGSPVDLGVLQGETASVKVPELPPGPYRFEIRYSELPQPKGFDVAIAPGVLARGNALQARVAKIQDQPGPALPTVRYLVSLPERADRSEISANIPFDRDLKLAEDLVAGLESGKDVLKNRTGDTHRAYLSKVDNTLQPYRVYVPAKYESSKPTALVVALHGMGGDENTLLDRYGSKALQDAAEKHGWIIAAPKGRDSASMYRGSAEQDVLDVLGEVRRDFNIDASRIYLTGHSMGAYGTWSIAQNHPEIFAALGPVAGGGSPAQMANIVHIPQYVVHGDNDKTVSVNNSRSMVEAGKKAGALIEYVEVPGGGHNEVYMPAIPRMFEFFAAHSRKAAGAAAGR